jgi:hypothetical protein
MPEVADAAEARSVFVSPRRVVQELVGGAYAHLAEQLRRGRSDTLDELYFV